MNRNWEKVSKYVIKKKVGKYELIRKSLHNVYDILSIIDSLTDQYYMALSFVYICLTEMLTVSVSHSVEEPGRCLLYGDQLITRCEYGRKGACLCIF